MSNETKTVEVIIKGQQANASLREIQAAARVLNAELRKLPTNSKEFADKTREFQAVDKRLKSLQNEVKGVGGVFGKIGQEIKAFGVIAAGALGFQWITGKMRDLIGQNAKLSDSFADIRKTTGMTEAEVQKLNKAFSQMNTRTATADLRAIAVSAGQLGIAKKDILAFTAATDKLVVALGDEFQGGAEEVSNTMGKLRNVFSDIKSDNISNDMLHIGNAVNELGAAGMATGPVISDFANRIGGVGINLGLTSGQVLGLSATLQELNVSTERGGTAISKILLKMTTDTDKFAKVAGMNTKDFAALVNKDLYGAFVKVAEGAKKGGTSATAFGNILDDLGVDGAGASEVFSKLGSNTKLLQEKVDLANKSLKGTDSIMNEFAIKNETFGANLDKIGRSLNSAFVSGPIMKGMQNMVGWLAELVDKVDDADRATETWKKQKTDVEKLEKAIIPLLVRHDELKSKSQLTADEQKELDEIVQQVAGNIPLAATEFDKYGKAMGISTDAAKEFIKVQEAILLEKNRDAIGKYEDKIKSLEGSINATSKALNKVNAQGVHVKVVSDSRGMFETEVKLTNKELAELQIKLNELQQRKLGSIGILNELKGVKPEVKEIAEAITEIPDALTVIDEEAAKKILAANKKLLDDIADQKVAAIANDEIRERAKADLDNVRKNAEINLSLASEDVKHKALESQKEAHEIAIQEIEAKYKEQRATNEAAYLAHKKAMTAEAVKEELNLYKDEEAQMDAIFQSNLTSAIDNALLLQDQQQKNKEAMIAGAQQIEQELSNTIFAAQQARIQREQTMALQASEVRHNTEAASLQARLTSGRITQAQFDRDKLRSDRRFAAEQLAIKKKAFEDEKRMKIAQLAINLAIELSNIAVAAAANPTNAVTFGAAGITQYGIQAGLAIARSAIQFGAIKAQKFAKGGFSNKPEGFTTGPTYYTNSASGKDFIAGEEGREYISPNWMVQHPAIAPIFEHLETIRQNRGFASGGSNSTKTSVPKFSAPSSTQNSDAVLAAATSAINRLNAHLDEGIEAYLSWDRKERDESKIENAKASARR